MKSRLRLSDWWPSLSRKRLFELAGDDLGRFADAEAVAELVEEFAVLGLGTVQVIPFCNQLHLVVAVDAVLPQDALERLQVLGVDDEQFVLVELDFHRAG